ncbi:TPA: Ig-like domain-containing protein [Photobacterium damselae]
MYRILLLIFFLISVVGCNSGDHSDNEKAKVQPPIASNVFSQVVISDKIKKISLKKQIRDPQGLPLELLSVKPETEGCPEPLVDAKDLSYTIDADSTGTCLYKYTVKNVSNNNVNDKSTSSENFVLISNSGVEDILPAISKTASISTDVNIDLKSELGSLFPDEYILDEPITVFGTGTAEVLDPSNGSVLFHASNEPGIVRLLYSISNDSTLDVKAGYIDISVSGTGNTAPTAKNDTLNSVKIDTDVVFDIHDLIEDADSDPLQLIDVYSINNAAYIKDEDKDDINNTKFTFHSTEYGKFDVSYVVYDHRDGFAVGVISFNVGSNNVPWNDITEKGQFAMTTYTAPITEQFARTHHIEFNETYKHVVDGVSYDIALMNMQQALAYCSSKNLDLPENNLDFQSSIKRHIPEGSSLTDYYKWPENINYFTTIYSTWEDYLEKKATDPEFSIAGMFGYVYCSDDTVPKNMWDGGDMDPESNDSAVITCTRKYQEVATLEKDHAYVSDVNDDSNPKIYNTIKLTESPIGNERVQAPRWGASTYVYSDSPSISFDSNNVPAVSDGSIEPATIKVYSRKAGQFVIKAVSRGQITETRMDFDEDSVSALSTDTSVKLLKSNSKTLSVKATFLSGKEEVITADKLTFASSDDSVAKVDGSGKITALEAGDAVITTTLASDNSVQVTTNVHVIKYSAVQLSLDHSFIPYDGTAQLTAKDPETGVTIPSSELTFTSNAPSGYGVSVNSSGSVSVGHKALKELVFTATLKDNPSLKGSTVALVGPSGSSLGLMSRNLSHHLEFGVVNISTSDTFMVGSRATLVALEDGSMSFDQYSVPPTSDNPDVATVSLYLTGSYDVAIKSAGVANICTTTASGKSLCLKITN